MKFNFFIKTLFLIATFIFSNVEMIFAVDDGLALRSIMKSSSITADNTSFGVIALLSFIAALISALFALGSFVVGVMTMRSQQAAEKNTRGFKNIRSTQSLMLDMVRHFYWNNVISYAIAERMKQNDYKVYPSEDHLQKMKVHIGSIDLHIYLDSEEHYQILSNLYLLLRNYNTELDVINKHFKDISIDNATKERDLKHLIFKCDFLTRKIVEALMLIWGEKHSFLNDAIEIIEKTQGTRWSENESKDLDEGFYHYTGNDDSYYLTGLFPDRQEMFIDRFNRDVAIELGKTNKGADKIHMIPLK